MTIDILVCTIDDGISRIPSVLLPPCEGVTWIVSMQYTDKHFVDFVPSELRERKDVILTFLEGKGLSRNRNNAFAHAKSDILLIADDDCRYTVEALHEVIQFYEHNPSSDIVCFAAADYEGNLLKTYPKKATSYGAAVQKGYYATSFEMSMRKGLSLRFDERFGLGSDLLCAGEEAVFICDALKTGYQVMVVPKAIVRSDANTTGKSFLGNKQLQITKGAVFRYLYGTAEAVWRSMKESAFYLVHYHANPSPILYNMLRGIWILQ